MTVRKKLLILILVIFTVFIRLVGLDRIPPHLSNDEISIAYDAYSILHTGRDEHNDFMPVSFQSHSTYKAPFYIYIAAVSNFFLGNSEVSVRLPSVFFGSLTVFALGYLVFLLSNNFDLSIISACVLSVTPWHIYTSRMALESNVALFLLVFALVLFFMMLKVKNNILLIVSMIFFALSIWGYHTQWLLTPMIMVLLATIYRKKIKVNIFFWISILLFFGLVFPIANNAWQNRDTTARANTETIFNYPGVKKIINNPNIGLFKKFSVLNRSFIDNYSNYTKLGHLFFDGLSLLPKEDPYSVGLFLLAFLPFFLWGIFKVKLYFPNDYLFIYSWLIISPVVPSLTIGGTNLVRNLATVVPYSLVIGIGIYGSTSFFNGFKLLFLYLSFVASFLYFSIIYFYHFPFQMGENFQYGYKQAAEFIKENYNEYDQIIVDPRFGDVNIYVGVPHLYIPYFTEMDPNKLLIRNDTRDGLFFDKYHITSVNWDMEKVKPKSLYLLPFDNLPSDDVTNVRIVKEIKLPNHKTEFKLFESF